MNESVRVTVFIGLGSNLDNPLEQVRRAQDELAALPETYSLTHSSLYQTVPVGPSDQPDFINAVARLETAMPPEPLLDALQILERRHQRLRNVTRWGPRSLDLDLLLYGQMQINTPRLVVPHPRLTQRAFVLIPLAELAPLDLQIPAAGTLEQILKQVSHTGVQLLR